MSSHIREVLNEHPNETAEMRRLQAIVTDPHYNAVERMGAALKLSEIGGPLLLESVRREVADQLEPKYEYRYIRGAKVKVRVN